LKTGKTFRPKTHKFSIPQKMLNIKKPVLIRCVYCLLHKKCFGLASWRVAVGSNLTRSEETPPTRRIATP